LPGLIELQDELSQFPDAAHDVSVPLPGLIELQVWRKHSSSSAQVCFSPVAGINRIASRLYSNY